MRIRKPIGGFPKEGGVSGKESFGGIGRFSRFSIQGGVPF